MSEISTKLEAAGLRVRGLEWESVGVRLMSRSHSGLFYEILRHAGRYCPDPETPWRMKGPIGEPLWFDTLDEAKVAAQADYTSRILAALEAAP